MDKEMRDQFQQLTSMITNMGDKITKMDDRITKMDDRITKMDDRITKMDDRITKMDDRITRLDEKVDGFKDYVDDRFKKLEIKMENEITKRIDTLFDGYKLNHEKQYEMEHEMNRRLEDQQTQIDSIQARLNKLESISAS